MRLERFNAYGGFSVPARGYGSDILRGNSHRDDMTCHVCTVAVCRSYGEGGTFGSGRRSMQADGISFHLYAHPL